VSLERDIRMAIETGKVIIGSERTLKELKGGDLKLVIVANNCPENIKADIEYYAKISKTPVYRFDGTNRDLGVLSGKPFNISVMGIKEAGESNILKRLTEVS